MTSLAVLRAVVLAAHAVLLVALPAWLGAAGLLLALPLLAAAPGLWRGHHRTYQVGSLLVLPYLGGFLMEAFAAPATRYPALWLAMVAVAEFCAVVLYVRLRARSR